MTWFVQSFSMQTDELLAEFNLDQLAADAVDHLIGTPREAPSPDQVHVIAPLFGIEPAHWEAVTGSSDDSDVSGSSWLSRALLHLTVSVVGLPPEDLLEADHLLSPQVAQGLLDRFSAGVRVPDGQITLAFYGPPLT